MIPRWALGAVAIAAAAGCAAGPELRPAGRPLPQVAGTLALGGLSAPVTVVRDRWGVPHIKAANQDDLFFAQGFVQAQDRLFQMDLWRRSVQGRLAEVLGSNFLERDGMTRRIQYRGDREADWASYGPDTKAIASAFVRGINAWIQLAHDPFPEEFVLAGWAPDWWRPEDLLNRTDAFAASADALDELFRAELVTAVGLPRARTLLAGDRRDLQEPRGLPMTQVNPVVGDLLRMVGTPPFFVSLAGMVRLKADTTNEETVRLKPDTTYEESDTTYAVGSNAWAVARSDTGSALVAGDPHRALEHPSLRYLVHLQAPGWNVIGATAPWLPGVAIGHNDTVAWTMAASRADTQDIYVERLNPDNPRQVMDRGRWVDVAVETDVIAVKGHAEPFQYEYLYTPHGVIVALDRERHLAYSVRWSGSEPGGAAELGALALDRAGSAEEFRSALRHWKFPPAEFVFADSGGQIEHRLAALVPERRGWNGTLPVPGHDRQYEWRGWTAPGRLDADINPARGFVIAANQNRARGQRIIDTLSDRSARSVDGFKRLQHDVVAWNAARLVPLLTRQRADPDDVEQLRLSLLAWDRRVIPDSHQAAAYLRWETALFENTASLKVPSSLVAEYVRRAGSTLVPALVDASPIWFEQGARQRDQLLLKSLAEAQDVSREGVSQRVVTFAHPLAVIDAVRRRYNRGPFSTPGYADTVSALQIARSGPAYGPSLRLIMDAGDWDRSLATNAPGQSGSADSPHFDDLVKLWAAGDYFPLPFDEAAVLKAAESTLTLVPR